MLPDRNHVMREIRQRLESAYGSRLRGIVLYGSEARGDAGPNSDIDLLVLLEGPVRLGDDLAIIIHALYPLELEMGRSLEAYPLDASEWQLSRLPLVNSAQREGVAI